MRIALVQLHAHEVEACANTGVPAARIAQLLSIAEEHNADLVVFPEGYPFFVDSDAGTPPSINAAITALQTLPPHSIAFIVGGYVMEDGHQRNASFLVHEGQVQAPYFKRVPWLGEAFKPGAALLRWSWNEHQVIPLICADVCVPWNEPDGSAAKMLGETAALGAGPSCPVIVTTFGADLRKPYWTEPLRAWARACNAPVLVSAVAGRSTATFKEGSRRRHYGGGGSGMFWFEEGQDNVWPRSEDSEAVGMYVLDTLEPKSCWLPLGPCGPVSD
ncbi:hypothetical protein NB697_000807 [Xanthomonas sacchari]|uniref:hypothetical protein n=1 Tax=Xanthomonas sacchari TaxID=56458 RepID=UPI0022562FCC|nr:hypothetical protein [Xanthomonas sacchari]MCW0377961.1 hypothetical protein [Xanthomonas sacchari]